MSEQKQLKQLIKKRAIIKGKLTNFSTYLKYLKQCEETDPIQIQIELQLRLEKLEALYDEFDSFQNEIEEISEAIEDECKERQTFETLYYSLVSSGRALIASHRKLSMPSHDSMVATDAEDSSDINKPLVKVLDSNGQSHAARILLDNGSTTNFVTKDFCRKLNLNTVSAKYKVTGINNQALCGTESCSVTFESYIGCFRTGIDCIVLPIITTPQPSTNIKLQDLQIPSGICLADPSFHIPSTIDILVGADIFWSVIGTNRICLGKNKPTLFETQLGWIVSGTVRTNSKNDNICMLSSNLDFDLSRFWELDSISSKHNLTPEERACEEHFMKTTKRKPDGRFIVSLPLKESPEVLGDSYQMAKSRFLSLERKLARDSNMRQLYVEFMKEYLTLDHITEQKTFNNKACYLPHHGVLKESRTTTKLRVVYDASAATKSGKALNDILRVGPTVQDDLLSILLRFRQHKYVVTADVEKMYRQTEIFEQQRALQQILWRFDPSHPLKSYQLNTVTYGTASAPYLATRCLLQLSHEAKDPNVKRAIRHDFYVDDFLSGHTTIEDTVSLCRGVMSALSSAQLNLRKWYSNHQDILQAISGEAKISGSVDLSSDNLSKTLGLNWKCSTDALLFSIDIPSNVTVKKRHILSTIAQVFDPLGLVSPCIVEAKIIMQQLWINKCGWDDSVPTHIRQAWFEFANSLPQLNTIHIPRCVTSNSPIDMQLHIFTDASEKAYGACIYIRCLDNDGTVTTHLLASKSKVAPIKTISIPRLELSSALLGTRLGIKVLNSLTLQFSKCILWSDSTIVLGWLGSSPTHLKPFVRHRVSEIQESFADHEWRYVPSKENPADLASRGLKADALGKSSLWWSGPSFLKSDQINWPEKPKQEIQVSDLPETVVKCFHTTDETNSFSKLISNCSSLSKVQRVTALIFRFINICRNRFKRVIGNITTIESNVRSQHSPADTIEEGIHFSFIPAYILYFGDIWESAVKSVKRHLRRVLGLTYLDYEEMNTLLIQIEAILNSRPITPLSDDPSDLYPLTPAHFLIGRSLLFAPQTQISCSRISSLARFHRIELLKQHFWGRFSNEYITLLQQKTKWLQSQRHLKEGDLVVIKEKTSPPLMWLLGRIVHVLPGGDGVARVADIKTKKGIIRRAFNNICPLPTSLEDTSTPGVCSG
ncbi:uncharacterized protein [Maniola hyperantus]|uniref:uncharacterized protein n=1 Tax=Aphantopus hyperantus TaxID=2795564 RepID=UPI00374945D5